MAIAGYILIGIGVIGFLGNMTGAGGMDDPDPAGANKRAGCFVLVGIIGGLLVYFAS